MCVQLGNSALRHVVEDVIRGECPHPRLRICSAQQTLKFAIVINIVYVQKTKLQRLLCKHLDMMSSLEGWMG